MGNSPRRRSFLMRGLGVIVAIAIAIGIWLGGLFKNIGFDTGTGGGTVTPLVSSDSQTSLKDSPQPSSEESEDSDKPNVVGTQEVVVVIIDDRSYFLRADIGVTETRVSLDALIELVKNAQGNEDEIRLRVFRRNSARASTENALKQALSDSQIPSAAVQWVDEIIP